MSHSLKQYLTKLTYVLVTTGCLAIWQPAYAEGPFLGVDVSRIATELDYGLTEDYTTTHLRISGGYEFSRFFALEAQLYSSGSDTQSDPFGDKFEYDTGAILGLFARPQMVFSKGYVYGRLGLLRADSEYTEKATGLSASDTNTNIAFGVGGGFVLSKRLRVGGDLLLSTGEASYGLLDVDVYQAAINAGVSFYF